MKNCIYKLFRVVLMALMIVSLSAGCSGGGQEELFPEEAAFADAPEEASPAGEGLMSSKPDGYPEQRSGAEEEAWVTGDATTDSMYVYICGEVKRPGVYEMKPGSRVYELLDRCGGYTQAAADTYINQAEALGDGERIYVPSKEELESGQAGGAGAPVTIQSAAGMAPQMSGGDGLVNINTADMEELQTIKGIGASRAEDIIAYRQSNGAFHSIEEIMKVPGIKEGLFSKIKGSIRV